MRTVLIGSDFMFNQNGDLIPIEINTNLDMNRYKIENDNDIFDFTSLNTLINNNSITKITYIGALDLLNEKLNEYCTTNGFVYTYHQVSASFTIPLVEDGPDHLIIRSAYDQTAIVDSEYCANKINFLNLIKEQSFGTQFAYIDETNTLINNITTFVDNGNHPNFIVKAVEPFYNQNDFPKYYKITNQTELNNVLSTLTSDYFLMSCHLNLNKLYNDHIQVYRSYNLLFPPNLDSITIGQYRRFTAKKLDEFSTFDVNGELSHIDRIKYLTDDSQFSAPKLLDTDRVEMADGTFKTPVDLVVGEYLKTIDIPNPNNVDISTQSIYYNISYDQFLSGVTYSTNRLLDKQRVDKLVYYTTLTFTDGTTWEDTENSSYLVSRNNMVMFVKLYKNNLDTCIKVGDNVILLDTTSQAVSAVLKEVSGIDVRKEFFGGWVLTVERQHLFLTQTNNNTNYVTIEHNLNCFSYCFQCENCNCGKGKLCCDVYSDPYNQLCVNAGSCFGGGC